MQSLSKICYLVALLLITVLWVVGAEANLIPAAKILYAEEQISINDWQYDFTFMNTTVEVPDKPLPMFAVLLELNEPVNLLGMNTPAEWTVETPVVTDGFPVFGVEDIFTQTAGPGIAVGSSLSGFSFRFDQPIGNIPFVAFFWETDNGLARAITADGTTAPIPEPATILLLTCGLAGLGVIGRKKIMKK